MTTRMVQCRCHHYEDIDDKRQRKVRCSTKVAYYERQCEYCATEGCVRSRRSRRSRLWMLLSLFF